MSYSFSVRGATREEAIAAVGAKLAEVVASQRIHAADAGWAQDAAKDYLSVLTDAPEGKDFCVQVSGSLSWDGMLGSADQVITGASVNVSVRFVAKEVAESAPTVAVVEPTTISTDEQVTRDGDADEAALQQDAGASQVEPGADDPAA